MDQGYNNLGNGLHVFFDSLTVSKITINTIENTASYDKNGVVLEEGAILEADATEIIEAMKVPGTGLGMLLIKLGRAFERAIGGGSSAK